MKKLALQMAPGFDPSHALIVRPMGDGYQIISGHNRVLAAQKAGWPKVPCWVRELDDDEAYMQLVLCNTQSELHPLEEGLHSLRSGKSQSQYARETGKTQKDIALREYAAKVYEAIPRGIDHRDAWRNLAEIHAAPQWLWSALVTQMLADGWTVAQTRAKVAELKETADPAGWMDAEALASALVSGTLRPAEIQLSGTGNRCTLTVNGKRCGTGALVRYSATGLYAQCNAGVLRSLDQRAVSAALAEG